MLTDRQSQILNTIIDEYINTATPVSSGVVFDKDVLGVSSPTIRNEMAELTDLGFLIQPHTSAGRMPTERGYRFFVDMLISKRKSGKKSVDTNKKTIDKAREISQNTDDLVILIDEVDGEVKYLGLKKVFENPEFKTHSAVLSMLEELERFENYSEVLNEYLSRDLEIFIGAENPFFENSEYSMIWSRFNNSAIAVVGPMRMRYKINLSLLGQI